MKIVFVAHVRAKATKKGVYRVYKDEKSRLNAACLTSLH